MSRLLNVSPSAHVRLRKSQAGALAASEPLEEEVLQEIPHIVSQEQAEIANISHSGCTEALFAAQARTLAITEQVRLCTTLGWRTGATFYAILRLRKSRFCASSAIHSPLWEPGKGVNREVSARRR